MSDRALVQRLLVGEDAAFDEFFAEYFPRLFRFACVRVRGNEDRAEEAVQATLVRAVRHLGAYRGEAALFTWLCTICRREVARLNERCGAIETPLLEDQPEIRAALESLARFDAHDPEHDARRADVCRLVQATLDHLPTRYGNALEWKYIDELSVEDIADRLGVSYKAAESLLSRARQAFRDGFRAAVPEDA